MSKPYGIGIDMRVKTPSCTEDAIWDAVEAAIIANWTPEQFRIETASAWRHVLDEQAKHAETVFGRRA